MAARGRGPSRGDLKRNIKQLKAILVKNALDLDARVRVARTLRLLDKPKEAVQHYRAVARYLALAGQPLQAIAVLKELLQLDPDHQETLLFLAKLYARTRGAVASNVGRIAVPIDDGHMPTALAGEWPLTSTGVWRAIRPRETHELVRELSPEEAGAEDTTPGREVPEPVELALHADDDEEPREPSDVTTLPDLGVLDDTHFDVVGEPSEGELLLPQVPLFSSLSQRAFMDLARAMVHRRVSAGTTLFSHGDPEDSLLLISRGRVRAYRPCGQENTLLEVLGPGDILGVLGFISPRGRAATIIAETDLEYFEMERQVFDQLIQDHPPVEKSLHRFVRHRLLMTLLAQLPVVRDLPSDAREAIARRFKQRRFHEGEELIYEGAEFNSIFLLLRGRLVVGPEGPSGEVEAPVARLEPGDLVGCLAGQGQAQADVCIQALEDGACAVITHKVFEDLAVVYPQLRDLRRGLDEERMLLSDQIFSDSADMRAEQLPMDED